jgi:tol-pal system protein YbgF
MVRMKGNLRIHWITVVLLAGFLGGCAALNQDARINFLEGQMQDVLQKSAEWDISSKDVRTRIADYGAQMDSLQEQMQRLYGTIEEIESGGARRENPIFSQRGTAEEIRSLKERIDFLEARVNEMEMNLSSGTPAAPGTAAPNRSSALAPATPKPSTAAKRPPPPPKKPAPQGSGGKAQQAYSQATDAMNQKQYEKAIRLYRGFIKVNSGHDLNDNAQYWIGECYYAQKKYEEAIIEFEEVIQQYPSGDKVPAALLKEGLAFHALKDNVPARQILKKLVDQYPASEEAKLATEKLKGF